MRSMIRIKRTFNLILTLALWFTMAQTTMAAITDSGTADDPYLISSTEDWNTFANNVNNGTSYSGQTVKLNADISVTTMVGTYDNPFNGTFDGGGYQGTCGNILIEGGTIEATGGQLAAGIGGGYMNGTCDPINITSGVTKVTATKGSGAPNSIGKGKDGAAITVSIAAGANVTQN